MDWIITHWAAVLGAVYVVLNEVIALAPNLKSNSIVQLIVNILKSVVAQPQEPPK